MDEQPSPRLLAATPRLLAANQRLQALRTEAAALRQAPGLPVEQGGPTLEDIPWNAAGGPETRLPDHLGWGSEPVTAALRAAQQRRQDATARAAAQDDLSWLPKPPTTTPIPALETRPQPYANEPITSADTVKLYPDIALGMLREEVAAAGRIWLLLRWLDKPGCGHLRIAIAQQHLTSLTSNIQLCGSRQLRNLLQAGEGIFWIRDEERIWLYSAAKAAAALDVTRLTGRPVALPVTALLAGIGEFRAHLYASFHSGRAQETGYGHKNKPIARETLTAISGVGRRSQQAYEKRLGLKVQHNFAVGEEATPENREERAWRQGNALFEIKDYRGEQGAKGKSYLAWQLPNTYQGHHQHRPQGKQKRINRHLKDLVMKGMPGNVEDTSDTSRADLEKRYYASGKLAVKACGRRPEHALYWERQRTQNGRFDIWQHLGEDV